MARHVGDPLLHIFVTFLSNRESLFNPGRVLVCRMVSDSLSELCQFATQVGIRRDDLAWSYLCFPYFLLTPSRRERALSLGAHEITYPDLVALSRLWLARRTATLDRLSNPLPFVALSGSKKN